MGAAGGPYDLGKLRQQRPAGQAGRAEREPWMTKNNLPPRSRRSNGGGRWDYGPKLLPHHAKLLADSGIAPKVAIARLSIIPEPFRRKAPDIEGCQDLRLTKANPPRYFSGQTNLGALNGEPSRGLVNVDLDSPEAVALAPLFLPSTDCVFGRQSKRRSHWVYRCNPPPKTKKFLTWDPRDPTKKIMIVELRGTGTQTVWPPSTHPSGQRVRFS